MSHTDKTKPFRVSLWHGTFERVAVHDHTDGICDLPESLEEDLSTGGAFAGCHWDLHYTGRNTCCCQVCHDAFPDRTDRYRSRRELREDLKALRADPRALDD